MSAARVKICGHVRREDLLASAALGADYLGVVLSAGFARSVALRAAPALAEDVDTTLVAVVVDEDADGAELRANALGAAVIQLHGEEPPELLLELAQRGPWRLWKAVRARRIEDVERAVERYGTLARGLLVEGFRDGVVGGGGARLELGGPALRGAIPEHLDLIVAGGLSPETVARTIERFRPDVVDVSSGVEESVGVKSATRIGRFIEEARGAGAAR